MTQSSEIEAMVQKSKATRRRRGRRLNGEGTICQRADGRWCAAVSLDAGQRRFFYGASADEVARKLQRAKETIRQGRALDDERMTVGALLERFLDERRGRTRLSTMVDYENVARNHIAPSLGQLKLRKLTATDVQRFLDKKRTEVSATMTRHIRTVLSMAVRLAVSWDLASRNVVEFVRGPKSEAKPVDPLDVDETRKLLAAAKGHRLEPLWLLAATLGVRRGELLGLAWSAIDLDVGQLHVRQQLQRVRRKTAIGAPKTSSAIRTLRLTPLLMTALQEHRRRQAAERLRAGPLWQDKDGLVFTQVDGSPLIGPAVSQMHRRLCKRAGVRNIRLHDLRHGAATIMLASGVDPRTLSETLGHSRVSFTLNTYAHTKRPQLDAAVDRVSAALLG